MAGLKVYSSQQRRQGPNGAGRIDPEMYRTGEAAATLAATGSVGRSLEDVSAVAVQLNQAEVMIDLARRTGDRNQLHRDAMRRIEDEPDVAAHESIIAEFDTSLNALGKGLDGFAADRWQADLQQNANGWKADLVDASNRRKKELLTGDVKAMFETAIRNRDKELMSRAGSTAVLGGLMTQVQAENELAKGTLAIQQGYIVEQLTADLTAGKKTLQEVKDLLSREEVALTLPDGRIDRAKLPAETRQAMVRDLITWHSWQAALDEEQMLRAKKDAQQTLTDAWRGTLTDADGKAVPLNTALIDRMLPEDPEGRMKWYKTMDTQVEMRKKAAELRYVKSDNARVQSLLTQVANALDGTGQMPTDREVIGGIGVHWSFEDAQMILRYRNDARALLRGEKTKGDEVFYKQAVADLDSGKPVTDRDRLQWLAEEKITLEQYDDLGERVEKRKKAVLLGHPAVTAIREKIGALHKSAYFVPRDWWANYDSIEEAPTEVYLRSAAIASEIDKRFVEYVYDHPEARPEELVAISQTLIEPGQKELALLKIEGDGWGSENRRKAVYGALLTGRALPEGYLPKIERTETLTPAQLEQADPAKYAIYRETGLAWEDYVKLLQKDSAETPLEPAKKTPVKPESPKKAEKKTEPFTLRAF